MQESTILKVHAPDSAPAPGDAGDSGKDSSITSTEVTQLVRKLFKVTTPGVDETRPEYPESLDVQELLADTSLYGTACLDQRTCMVVPLLDDSPQSR